MANGVTSEWEDIHVKLGNYVERPKVTPESEHSKREIDRALESDPLENKNLEELKELEDDFDDDFLEEYKKKRMAEIEALSAKPRFGKMWEIDKQQYVHEVTNAPKDIFVVLSLYQDYNEKSVKINECLAELAQKHVHTKFLKIKADKCIEDFPDNAVPCMIIYRSEKMAHNIFRVDERIGKLTTDATEWFLKSIDVLEREPGEEIENNDKYSKFMLKKDINQKKDADASDSDEDDREYMTTHFKRI
jgi:hypothetical protein